MSIFRLTTASLMLSLMVVSGCVKTEPKTFKEVAPANPPQTAEINAKPSPLTLAVHVDAAGGVTLNREPLGTADDTGRLSARLKHIFAERKRNRVYEPGSDKIAKAVFVIAPRAASYTAVTKVLDAIKAAGGGPIGLQLEDK